SEANLIDITGTTTDVASGSTVAITVTDVNGTILNLNAIVGDDGSYSVGNVDITNLADGNIEIYAESVDNNGNAVSGTDTLLLDLIESALTVAAVLDSDSATVDIDGSSVEVAAGTTVNLVITDSNGFTMTASAIVDAAGNYSV